MAYPTRTVTVNDEADLRAAITGAADGDSIYVPAGTYTLTAQCTITKAIQLFGQRNQTIINTNSAIYALRIDPTAGAITGIHIHDLKITGNTTTSLDGISNVTGLGNGVNRLIIERVVVFGCKNGITLDATGVPWVYCTISGCETLSSWGVGTHLGQGIYCKNVSALTIVHLETNSNKSAGISLVNCNPILRIENSASEGNNTNNGASSTLDSHVHVSGCHNFVIDGLDVEAMPTAVGANKCALAIVNCVNGSIRGLNVTQTAFQSDSIGVHLMVPLCKGIVVDEMLYSYLTTPILVDSGCESPFIRSSGITKFAP